MAMSLTSFVVDVDGERDNRRDANRPLSHGRDGLPFVLWHSAFCACCLLIDPDVDSSRLSPSGCRRPDPI